ncbi:putative protein [Arabidopsis thaliana]|uniref:Gamma-interferon-responsive lysosomal thiol protein n=1 Tax=Arabidopsis thaliana TaxID=3702 RepID=GILT_ARATH|nr:Gamma interferon responsive lysosomal thiol (GILT) reductase family protein [Arabidopsis thaliana]Q9SV73.1 RecName: Full=Gamma-interferon-responsive lysosomal thiol protein; Short=AtGILT; Flags: Precursor [Arabidopsis thaliana]AAL25536.1 AT4g12960/F25G13_50 [Arabidopsis thaliana]AAN18052.1 At4g12960/F25G13_50 [Arabidopsis thaliana]AEE83207.1 Gamma interferon responsive lysosomal thiol (GILT) reductase family protein [Arabidopsis thaliana]CAB45495.1 putative protein [Arabidopsis thaliana]CA|eukprot:NP_193032.1 Gamma interferon responsive lysosomal thiol (GILT) reductase family protein [Arabidopsis thaliana]
MVSSSLTKLVFFGCLLLLTFTDNLVAGKSGKVKLNLYYESLCPGCQEFIVDDLGKIFDYDLYTITDLKLFPFGNAELSDNLTVTCQHGEEECKLNALEACALRTWPDQKSQYSFIRCVESDTKGWESCVKNSGREKAINDCYNGDLSRKLILGYATKTKNLKPPHEYVPWVTLNGKPLDDSVQSTDDLVAQICNAYKGKTTLPKVCNSSASMSKSPERKWKLQVSYANKATNY